MRKKIIAALAGFFLMSLAIVVSAQTTDQNGGYGGLWAGGQGSCNTCNNGYGRGRSRSNRGSTPPGGGYGRGGGYGQGGGQRGNRRIDPHYPLFPLIDGLNHGLLGGLFDRFPGRRYGLPGFNNQQGNGYGQGGGNNYNNGGRSRSNRGYTPPGGGYGRGGRYGQSNGNPTCQSLACTNPGRGRNGRMRNSRPYPYEPQKNPPVTVNW